MSTTSELNFVGAGSRLLWSPTFCWAHLHWRLTFFCKAHLHWRLTFFCQARLHWRLTFFCQARPLVKHFIIGVRSLPSRNITCYALLSPGWINRIKTIFLDMFICMNCFIYRNKKFLHSNHFTHSIFAWKDKQMFKQLFWNIREAFIKKKV